MNLLFDTEQYYQLRSNQEMSPIAQECMRYLAHRIQDMWKLRLQICFPEREFQVIAEQTGDEEVWGVTFYEERTTYYMSSAVNAREEALRRKFLDMKLLELTTINYIL